MRRLSLLFVLLLVLAACGNDDDADTDVDQPSPTPTEIADDLAPVDDDDPAPERTPTPEEESIDETPELLALVDQVVENVVELRGLEMLEELDFSLMSRDQLAAMLEEDIEFDQHDIDLYWIFRLIDDRDIDLEQILIDAQSADIYGLYDPATGETYVIADDPELGAMEEVFLAHEIVHALQDQHFDLGRLEALEYDNDAALALRSIAEGDAVLSQELYAQRYFDEDQLMEYHQQALEAIQDPDAQAALDALPRYFVEWFSFPYIAGAQLMILAFDGGFDPMNQLLEDPPISTQQVINAREYLAGEIDDPVDVEIPDMLDRLGNGWESGYEGTFGVFDLTILLEENGVAETEEPLAGWRGTAFSTYSDGEEVIGILSTEWASGEAAGLFEGALVQTMDGYVEEGGIWSGEDRFHTIIVDGTGVRLKSASSEDALRSVSQMQ